MTSHLIVFDRSNGTLVRQESFQDHAVALQARFAAEREFRASDAIEVVVLNARSEADLRRTHQRYFVTLREIVTKAVPA